ncbi:MAG TPA: sulfotransferase [Myxococcota bacterium]|nr:sulfotransferase [Myxococcota bacterium]
MSAGRRALRLALRAATSVLLVLLTAILWPVYLLLAARHGWAPNVPGLRQLVRFGRLAWTVRPPDPGLTLRDRVWLSLSILRLAATVPLLGTAWLLDELLYGDALRAVRIEAPLVEVSAARSGSTQLARYLETDPGLVSPTLLQCVYPYLWLWRLAGRTVGRFVTREWVRARTLGAAPPSFAERHEGDPFRTDTFEVPFLMRRGNHLSLRLGPEAMAEDFAFGPLAPHNRELWEHDFVRVFDGIGRRTLLDAEPGPDGRPRRLFIKGHFLCAAPALARRHPDARFLTMIREPAPRLQSAINFLRTGPFEDDLGGPPPWGWLGAGIGESEAAYCEIEQEWFTREDGPRRCVVRFSDYIRDLEGTLARVYRECLDTPTPPDGTPRQHEPRRRHDYTYDRSLAEVGIDEAALNARLAAYVAWCRGEDRS